jgi:hypothetical protein
VKSSNGFSPRPPFGLRFQQARLAPWLLSLAAVAFSSLAAAREEPATQAQVLSKSDYRLPMEEVIAIGRVPYWRKDQAPQYERQEMELQESKARLQWAPKYSRDERDDYNGVRDQLNPQPRAKVFEVKF